MQIPKDAGTEDFRAVGIKHKDPDMAMVSVFEEYTKMWLEQWGMMEWSEVVIASRLRK